MKPISTLTIENFRQGPWRIFRDNADQVVPITCGPEFEGYLVHNKKSKTYGQVRFVRDADRKKQARLGVLLDNCERAEFELLPEVLMTGMCDSVPFYINELPVGETIRNFFNSKGAIPPETAVLLMLDFVKTLRDSDTGLPTQMGFHPGSIWLCRAKGNPRIQFGDINEVPHADPLQHNLKICADLLRYLTEDHKKPRFQQLCEYIATEAIGYEDVVAQLTTYTKENPAANFWMGYNEPACILERVKPATMAKPDEDSVLLEAAKRHVWPVVVAVTVIVMSGLVALNFIYKPEPVAELIESTKRTVQRVASAPKKSVKRSPSSAPRTSTKSSGARSSSSKSSGGSTVVFQSAPDIDPNSMTPELREILAKTGLFEDVLNEPVYDWMVEDIDAQPEFESPEKAAEQQALTHLQNASLIAKHNNDLFDAISIELAVLKIAPDSFESRVRLHDYLTEVKNSDNTTLDDVSKNVLVEAASQNSLAREILIIHNKRS